MAARHVKAIVLRAPETKIGAAFRQPDEGESLALGVEHHHAVQIFGLALELVHLAAADIGRLGLQGAVAAPATPEVTVAVDPEAIQRTLVGGVDGLGPGAERTVGVDVIAPDTAIGRSLPLDDVKFLFVRRERQAIGIDAVGNPTADLAVPG